MSEKELDNAMEGLAEVGELNTSNNTLAKVAGAVVIVAVAVGVVMYIRKKKNSKTEEVNEVAEDSKAKTKTQK